MRTVENPINASGLPLVYRIDQSRQAKVAQPEIVKSEAVRLIASTLSGFQKEAKVYCTPSGGAWRLVSDEGKNLNGHDAAPSPLGFFAAGLVAGYMEEVTALAKKREVVISDLTLTLDNFYTMQGSMPKRTMVGGAQSVELTVEITCSLEGNSLVGFLSDAIHATPQNALVSEAHINRFTLTNNGNRLDTDRVVELEGRVPAVDVQENLRPLLDAKSMRLNDPLLQKLGTSPLLEDGYGPSDQEYSTSKPPSRPLHVRAIARKRPDGIKQIDQQLLFPRGSEWRFLSEEAGDSVGVGRAPDANTLLMAGIGFCFMTQLGILATATKVDIHEHAIVQDAHMSLGGASGGTGQMGEADAIQTHLYLNVADDAVAREMLDLAERACFLHALCSQKLKTKLKVLAIDRS